MLTLKRTGEKIPFENISIGSVFFAYGDYWTRTDYEAGTVLTESKDGMGSACYFCINPKDADEVPEIVEAVIIKKGE